MLNHKSILEKDGLFLNDFTFKTVSGEPMTQRVQTLNDEYQNAARASFINDE
jgi:hypothetical protein